MKKKLFVWGAGGHARVVADIVRLAGDYELAAFLDDVHPERDGEVLGGVRIFGGPDQLGRLKALGLTHGIVAIGNCAARLRVAEAMERAGFSAGVAVHPRAVVAADVEVAPGVVVAAGAVVSPGARLGAHAVVNTCASVDHDCTVAEGAHIAPGARLAGNVSVGRAAWVGLGAVVKESTCVGAGSLVGAGAVVLADVPDRVLVYGVPARVVRPL